MVRQAVEADRYWREVYVGVPLGDRLLEGFVDLLVEAPDGLEVVDYKTDRVTGAAGARSTAPCPATGSEGGGVPRWRGVERATGRPVARCTFLFLGPTWGPGPAGWTTWPAPSTRCGRSSPGVTLMTNSSHNLDSHSLAKGYFQVIPRWMGHAYVTNLLPSPDR